MGCGGGRYGPAMQVTPRYDGPAVLRFEGPIGDPSVPLLRQRRRLGEVLSTLSEDQWATPSRCDGWTVFDVVAHLAGTNQYWVVSARGALDGKPTRYLVGFDPAATPADMVDAMRHLTPADVLASFLDGVEQLEATVGSLDDEQWSLPAETPPGHIALHGMVRHALWDGWVHERDVLLPLGLTQAEEPDEVRACLEYAAAIGPALLASQGSTRAGVLAVDAVDPKVQLVVEIGESVVVRAGDASPDAARITGPAVDLVEAFTYRAPVPSELAPDDRWLLGSLAAAFDLTPAE